MRNKSLAVVCRFWRICVGFLLLSVFGWLVVGLCFVLFFLLEMAGNYECYD